MNMRISLLSLGVLAFLPSQAGLAAGFALAPRALNVRLYAEPARVELEIVSQQCFPVAVRGLPPLICYFKLRNFGNVSTTHFIIHQDIRMQYKTGPFKGQVYTGTLEHRVDMELPAYSANPEAAFVSEPISAKSAYNTYGEAEVTYTSLIIRDQAIEVINGGMAPAPLQQTYLIEAP